MHSSRFDSWSKRVGKRGVVASLGTFLVIAIATPALARYPVYQNVRNHDSGFTQFLEQHQQLAAELRAQPALVYDPDFRAIHPYLTRYLANHPAIWETLNEGGPQGSWGAYDTDHQWRAAYWWHQHHTGWFWDNHPEWGSLNSTWRAQDGDYDAQGAWHDRPWWHANNPAWVAINHRDWEADSP